ncbi:MAG: hypothetical protein CEN89_185 [Candidatus Berkelbacteria bacterium Licking1014_7]|uniref:Uncharacterized protein n=1 Tax=Candidatus Berkelbacteria bacterium Licking1014_7 TaxID=2017147 RepID=A0A554LJW8_9BACT|nr:MAG: hypothetical protein CEN89_185 [Candidatus Berkelbacteria bacterium Licking1014_7]
MSKNLDFDIESLGFDLVFGFWTLTLYNLGFDRIL